MLEATEDGSDSRLASSGREESPAATSKPNVDDRLVYKLVKVGDDGSVLPATEDEVFQSLVSGSGNGLSSFDADESGDGEDDEEDEEEDDERTEYDTDDEPDERARNSKTLRSRSRRAHNGSNSQFISFIHCIHNETG